DVEIAQLAERLNSSLGPGEQRVDLPAAMEQVRSFRSLGYGLGFDFLHPGMSTVAWALRPRRSSRSIVVSVIGPTERIRPESKAVIQAARGAIRRYTGT